MRAEIEAEALFEGTVHRGKPVGELLGRFAHDFARVANQLDYHAFWIAVKALCRRYDMTAAQSLRRYGRGKGLSIGDSYVLKCAQDVSASWLQISPKPYEPGTGSYLDDVDWEAEVRRPIFEAPPSTIVCDSHCCRRCRL